MEYSYEELKKLTLDKAKADIINAVYECTNLIECLEYAGKVRGNGHHIRQDIAGYAGKILEERWNKSTNLE